MQKNPVPLRFPRLNSQTVSLIGKKSLKNHKLLHRALNRLAAAEEAGLDCHDGVIILDSNS
jgi:hypothetical protein